MAAKARWSRFIAREVWFYGTVDEFYYMTYSLLLYLAFWRFIPTSEGQLNKDYVTPKVTKYQRCNFIIQIHKFTLKIDTISINLLFECVMIVEFLKYQFPRVSCHVSRDTFSKSRCMFLKSRRETTVFDQFCFRKGLKTCSRGGGGCLYLEGRFKGEFFCVTGLGGLYLEGLIHGGAYFWDFTVYQYIFLDFSMERSGGWGWEQLLLSQKRSNSK